MNKRKDRIEDLVPHLEAAEELGVSRVTMWEWARTGVIEPIRLSRSVFYRRSDVNRIKRQREVSPE